MASAAPEAALRRDASAAPSVIRVPRVAPARPSQAAAPSRQPAPLPGSAPYRIAGAFRDEQAADASVASSQPRPALAYKQTLRPLSGFSLHGGSSASSQSSSSSPSSPTIHVAISDVDPAGTDVSVSVSLSRKGQRHERYGPPRSAPAGSSPARRAVLMSTLFGRGGWALCGQLVALGVAVTLLIALITIPVLVMRMDIARGGAHMQTHHLDHEQRGERHVIPINHAAHDAAGIHPAPPPRQDASPPAPAPPAAPPAHQVTANAARDVSAAQSVVPSPAREHNEQKAGTAEVREAAEPSAVDGAAAALTLDDFALPAYDASRLPAISANVTLFTSFSPTWQHVPSAFPLRTWILLVANSSATVVVFVPDEQTCGYLLFTHHLPVRCVALPLCFDDRSRKRRRKVSKGKLVWEWDVDSRREANLLCLFKEAEESLRTPLLLYADHEMIFAADIMHALHAVMELTVSLPGGQALSAQHMAQLRQRPVILVGRSWEVDASSRPELHWEEDDALQLRRRALYDWLSDTRAASLLPHQRYLSSFPMASDVPFFATHNSHALHWFVYQRGVLPFHAVSKSAHMADDDNLSPHAADDSVTSSVLSHAEDLDVQHGWESFIVWTAMIKAKPAVKVIDVSDAAHVMHSHQQAAHQHRDHPAPPSLLIIPPGADAAEIARLTSNASDAAGSNPLPVPLSPALADYRLRCADRRTTSGCELLSNEDTAIAELLEAQASADSQIALLVVNADYLPLAYHWLCRAADIGLSSFLFIAEDRASYFALLARAVPVVLVRYARMHKPTAMPGTSSAWQYEETLLYRSAVLERSVLRHNLSVLVLHLDVLLFANPLPMLLAGAHRCDVVVPLNDSMPSGGLFYFPQTRLSRKLVRDLRACHSEDVLFAHLHLQPRFVFSDDARTTCLSQLSKRMSRRHGLRRCTFDPELYPTELSFFHEQRSQHQAHWPVAVHVDRQRGVHNKSRAMKDWRLWRWDAEADAAEEDDVVRDADERELRPRALRARQDRELRNERSGRPSAAPVQCLTGHRERSPITALPPALEPGAPFPAAVLHVHVLADGNAFLLNETLRSLTAARAPAGFSVHLHVDMCPETGPSASAQLSSMASSVRQLHWTLGAVGLRTFAEPLLLDAQWMWDWPELNATALDSRDAAVLQLALPMRAGQLVSPHAFTFISSLLSSHSLHADGHLIALCLLHLPVVLAETPTQRFGSRLTTALFHRTATLFRYQLSSLSGSAFFLPTLLHFLSWHRSNTAPSHSAPSEPASTYPCVPSLASNRLFLSDPSVHFDQWLQRYAFELGHYSLHTALRDELSDDVVVLMMDHPALSAVSSRVRLLSTPLSASALPPPPLSSLPLFDFHFAVVESSVAALAERSLMFAPHNPLDRTLGTGADDEDAAEELQRQLVRDQVEEEEEELPAPPQTLGAAGVAAEEAVKRTVTRTLDASEQQRLNSFIRLMVSWEQRTRKQAVPARNNPLALLYPGSLQDRCYVPGSAADVTADPEDAELRVRPFIPPASHPAYTSLPAYHSRLASLNDARLRAVVSGGSSGSSAPQLLVYQPQLRGADGRLLAIPLDRQLRGLYFAFLLSLCLGRWLLVDMAGFHELYAAPTAEHSWQWDAELQERLMRLLPSAAVNATHAAILRTGDLQVRFAEPLLFYRELVSRDRALLANPLYRWLPLALFGSVSRVTRTGAVMRHLLSVPRAALVQQAAALMDVLRLRQEEPPHSVFAVRLDFTDDAAQASADNPLPSVSQFFLACVRSFLSAYAPHPNATRILFSTNRPTKPTWDAVQRLLSPYGAVLTYADGLKRIRTRLVQALRSRGLLPLNVSDEDAPLLPAEQLLGFVLAEVSRTVVSDTTFGVFQAARNGYNDSDGGEAINFVVVERSSHSQQQQAEADSEQGDYCGPVRRLDRPRRIDIVY